MMIVDDSIFIRAILKQIIESDPENRYKVVASAKDGVDAISKLNSYDIDIITMDIEMPRMNGLEATENIMRTNPKPIIMLSSLTKKGAEETIKALSLGAVDFITKPESQVELGKLKEEIYTKLSIGLTAKTNNINRHPSVEINRPTQSKTKSGALTNLIVLGCSTGGPKALQKIVPQIPRDLPAAIVIVQHMPDGGYTSLLAKHLDASSEVYVKEAEDGDEVKDGMVFISPGGFHTEIFNRGGKYRIVLNKREPVSGHRPSVDVMFASAARLRTGIPLYGVVLTGMGSDGTKGSLSLKSSKATIFAESEETAVIFGMPKQIINKGLADYILNLEDVIPKITTLLNLTNQKK